MPTIAVEGMSCEHCERTVEEALRGVDGVATVEVDHGSGRATVDGGVEPSALVAAVEDADYTAHA